MLERCLLNYFQFGNYYFQQIKGASVGSPISRLIAEAVLQRFKRLLFAFIAPKFWKIYEDDPFRIEEARRQTKTYLNRLFNHNGCHLSP